MQLRFGFLGIGSMGISHVRQFHLKNAPRSTCTAICGKNAGNLKRALEVAPQAQVFRDEKELINSNLVDAVAISTPNFNHLELALETLKAGKHLFLEKPCGITLDECRQLVAAANKTDRVVMIGHELRYSPFFQRVKQLVDAGEIGRPRMVWTREARGPFQPKSQNWIQDDRRSGGMLVDKNCHQFDLMNWWCGGRPTRVAAFGGSAVMRVIEGPHQVNDHSTVNFEYDNGVIGTLQICLFGRDFPDEELELGIVGETGSLQTRISSVEILQWRLGTNQKEPIVHKIDSKRGEGWGNHLGFDEMHTAFVDAVLDGKPTLTTVADCVDATMLAIAAEQSIRTRAMVELSRT